MKNELVNIVNILGSYCICLVTKIKNSAENGNNFNLRYKTSSYPSYVVHEVHSSQTQKTSKTDEIVAEILKKHVLTPVIREYIEHLLTYMMARRFFAYPSTESILARCELV